VRQKLKSRLQIIGIIASGLTLGWFLPSCVDKPGDMRVRTEPQQDKTCVERHEMYVHNDKFNGWQTISARIVTCPSDDDD